MALEIDDSARTFCHVHLLQLYIVLVYANRDVRQRIPFIVQTRSCSAVNWVLR
jgi:hypothetical protein